jgi:hypothetical protein
VNGDASLYDRYMAQLPKYTNNPELYYRFATALAAFREPSLVNRTLEYALSPAVRSQDTPLVLGSMMGQRSPRTSTDATDIQVVTWNFVKGHWDELTKKLGMFQGIPAIVFSTGAFCSRDLQSDVQQFFQQHPVPAAQRALQQSMERIQNCVAVKERQSAPLSAWLAAPSR